MSQFFNFIFHVVSFVFHAPIAQSHTSSRGRSSSNPRTCCPACRDVCGNACETWPASHSNKGTILTPRKRGQCSTGRQERPRCNWRSGLYYGANYSFWNDDTVLKLPFHRMRDIHVIYGNQIIPPTNTHLEQDTFQYVTYVSRYTIV